MTDALQPQGYAFYERVASNSGRNMTFAVIGTGIIWLFSKVWLFPAKALFWLAALLNAVDVLQVLAITTIGVVAFAAGRRESKWVWAANLARIIEAVVCVTMLWLCARIIGYL